MVIPYGELSVLWLAELVGCFPYVVDCPVVNDIYLVVTRGLNCCLFLCFAALPCQVLVGASWFIRVCAGLAFWLDSGVMDVLFGFGG